MQLTPDNDHSFALHMSAEEWNDVYALARFTQGGLAYDCVAPYVAQVFRYDFTQPKTFCADPDLAAAFAGVNALKELAPAGEARLLLPKEAMRQFFIVMGIAAVARDQANMLTDAEIPNFNTPFPEIGFPPPFYLRAFDELLAALHEDRPLNIQPPPLYLGPGPGSKS